MVLAMEPVTEVWESLEEQHRNYHLLLWGSCPLLRVLKKTTLKKKIEKRWMVGMDRFMKTEQNQKEL